MTIFEALLLNRSALLGIKNSGGRLDDVAHLDLFLAFNKMLAAGHKVSYAISVLAERYGISQRSIYALIGRLKKPLQL